MRILVKSGIGAAGAFAAQIVNGPARARLAPMLGRFHAWWEGEDWDPEAYPAPAEAAADEPAAAGLTVESSQSTPWSPARRQVVEGLWGAGFSAPGDDAQVLALVAPLGLDATRGAIEIGAGLGGATRAIARETGAHVTGLEASPDLVEAAMALSAKAGLAKRAPVTLFAPPHLDLADGALDAIVSREALFALAAKDELFADCHRVLKPAGQLLVTDYLLARDGDGSAAFDDWIANELPQPRPWSVARTLARLDEVGFELRASEDVGAETRKLALAGWDRFVRMLSPGAVAPDVARAIVGELELWRRRLELLAAGALCCRRIHAVKRKA